MNPISYSIRTLLAPSPDYRWGEHLCLLAPLGAIMAFVILCLGWWGEPVRQFFSPLATADIHITRFMSIVTHIGNPLIYLFYLVLLLVALTKRDWREAVFVLRCVLFSMFFLCFVNTGWVCRDRDFLGLHTLWALSINMLRSLQGIRRLSSPQPCLWHFGSETVLFPFSSRQ